MKKHAVFTNPLLHQIVVYGGLAYLLNFFWESWHAFSLYAGHGMDSLSIGEYVSLMGYVSFVDALLILSVLGGGMVLWKKADWFQVMNRAEWIYFTSTLLIIAIVIEIKAVFIFEQWSYTELMPTVFGLGLSPLLQLATTGTIALLVARRISQQ